jgi:spore maturation protein CgeB
MNKSITFVGDLSSGSRSLQRFNALKDLGLNATALSFTSESHQPGISKKPNLWSRIRYRLGFPVDETKINCRILKNIKSKKPDCLWIEKGLMVWPETLNQVRKLAPQIKIIFNSEDDMFGKHNQSKYFLSCLPKYDVVFTTKSYNLNLEELPSLGAKKVIYVKKAYDKNTHRPVAITSSDNNSFQSLVSFIGTYEKDRKDKLMFLAQSGIKVRVWGNGWSKYVRKHQNLVIENKPIFGNEYAKAICSSKINLCFLRKINRDLQTDRSVEIPACGGFMLAENSQEHQELFEENKEAVYFDINNLNELLEKTNYYLEHEEERTSIAKAGRQRCIKSGYSHHERLTWMLKQVYSGDLDQK